MSVEFESKRLRLRTFKKEDLDACMRFWGNEEVMKYCLGAVSKERIVQSIEGYNNLQEMKGFSVYAVEVKEDNELIGCCGFNPSESDNEIELIYHFAQEHWGKGYATEAATLCIEYAQNNISVDKIVASVHPKHDASRKILEKLGFEFKGMKWFEDTKQEEPCFEMNIKKNYGYKLDDRKNKND
jgi:ribosomal-protein-alanine N-acetyltransferase